MRLQQPQLVNALDHSLALALIGLQQSRKLDLVARSQDLHHPLTLLQALALDHGATLHFLVLRDHALEVQAPFLQAFVAEDGVCAQQGRERVGVFAAEGVFREAGEEVAVDHQADFGGESEEGGGFLG